MVLRPLVLVDTAPSHMNENAAAAWERLQSLSAALAVALSHYRLPLARLCSEHAHQAAAVTACYVLSASPRNWRSV